VKNFQPMFARSEISSFVKSNVEVRAQGLLDDAVER
jgi:hypothetical protein